MIGIQPDIEPPSNDRPEYFAKLRREMKFAMEFFPEKQCLRDESF